jgi:hypothetical protein
LKICEIDVKILDFFIKKTYIIEKIKIKILKKYIPKVWKEV